MRTALADILQEQIKDLKRFAGVEAPMNFADSEIRRVVKDVMHVKLLNGPQSPTTMNLACGRNLGSWVVVKPQQMFFMCTCIYSLYNIYVALGV